MLSCALHTFNVIVHQNIYSWLTVIVISKKGQFFWVFSHLQAWPIVETFQIDQTAIFPMSFLFLYFINEIGHSKTECHFNHNQYGVYLFPDNSSVVKSHAIVSSCRILTHHDYHLFLS